MQTAALLLWLALPGLAEEQAYDVVVYGGTSAGVMAAVQARRMDKTVVLVEPSRHLGGLTTGGLGATDIGNKRAIGGVSREFYQQIRRYYAADSAWVYERREDFRGRGHRAGEDAAWTFEPHVALDVYREMLRQADVPVVMGTRLDLKNGVEKQATRITAIRMESGRVFRARMFIDATYEGDLMAAAGVSYTVGREANSKYGETLSGVQTGRAIHHQFDRPVDPYVEPGVAASGLLAGIQAGGPGAEFSGDRRVQAYCFRLCATTVPRNRRPWPKPDGYDPARYELLLRNLEAGDHRICWNPVLMPNLKTDSNNNFAVSTDNIGLNYDYPDGDYATRQRIVAEHRSYQMGLMWTLANHPRVPAEVRREFQRWGLARDEFVDHGNWPPQLYIREARRMVSAVVMTEHHCLRKQIVPDSVGMAAYTMDSHHVQRYVDGRGQVRNEGDVQVRSLPFPISYRSIVPAAGQCANLLVPVCLSASHIAFGSIRMEPVFMVLGQSAATAAVHAIEEDRAVQQIDYARLADRLRADKQVLDFAVPPLATRVVVDPGKLAGVIVDDADAQRTGFDTISTSASPYVQACYRHDGNTGKGAQRARFIPTLPAAGRYEVRVAYSPSPNRATNVPVTVRHADGSTTSRINQRQQPDLDQAFVRVGTYRFAKGNSGWVEISNAGTDGYVVIDAVQFVPAE